MLAAAWDLMPNIFFLSSLHFTMSIVILFHLRSSAVTHSISAILNLHVCRNTSFSTPIFSQMFVMCYNISYVTSMFLKDCNLYCLSHCSVWDPASTFQQLIFFVFVFEILNIFSWTMRCQSGAILFCQLGQLYVLYLGNRYNTAFIK
jgi:hypothetical protein